MLKLEKQAMAELVRVAHTAYLGLVAWQRPIFSIQGITDSSINKMCTRACETY